MAPPWFPAPSCSVAAAGQPLQDRQGRLAPEATRSTQQANPGKQKGPHEAGFFGSCCGDWRSLGDSNPCFSLERATS